MDYTTLINKPKTKKGRETLNRILSAAAQVFYEKGYYNSSINDITRLAGVAAGTFYVYFESKYDLYKFLLLQCSHMIRKNLTNAIQDCTSRWEAEKVGLREWLRYVRKNQYMYHIIWESLHVDKQLFVDYYVTFSEAYIKGIDAAKERGEINPDIGSDVLAWSLMGASNFLGLNWGLFTDQPSDFDRVVDDFMKILGGEAFLTMDGIGDDSAEPLPIRIEVEFGDEDLEDEPETESEAAEDV